MVKTLLSACVCLCLAAGTLRAQSDELVATARKTLQIYEKGVISVSTVLKLEAKGASGAGEHEQKGHCEALVIDPSGLAVTSLASLQPKRRIPVQGRVIEIVSEVQEAKYHLQDGTEIPARVVLKDDETDLAFLAPQKPLDDATKAKLAVIPMSDAGAAPELLDPTIVIKRGGDAQDYVPMLDLSHITCIMAKPRTCYTTDKMLVGTPAFDKQGKVLGIFVNLPGILTVLLPAADVAKLVDQAKEEAKKPANDEKASDEKAADEKPADEKKE